MSVDSLSNATAGSRQGNPENASAVCGGAHSTLVLIVVSCAPGADVVVALHPVTHWMSVVQFRHLAACVGI